MTQKKSFKIGQKVYVEFNKSNGDWNLSEATVGLVLQIDDPHTRLQLLDGKKLTYGSCWVYTSSIIPEELYNSPLYKALR